MAGAGTKAIEKSSGPDGTFVPDLMSFVSKHEDVRTYIPGDVLSFSGLEDTNGLKLIKAVAQELPPDEDDFDAHIRLTIHADAKKYRADGRNKNTLLKSIKKWLTESDSDNLKILSHDIVRSEPAFHEVCTMILVESYVLSDLIGEIEDSTFKQDVWNKHMNKIVTEGVCYVKGKVPNELQSSLRQHIDEMAQKTPIDYHPKSNDIVRDLVHPALYPYIKGVSKLKKNTKLPKDASHEDDKDFWGRPYEDSKFQWLPTPFKITNERKCLIQEYINNLDQTIFPDLYKDLASLFEIFLPYFEEVWSYAKAMDFFKGQDEDGPIEEDAVKSFKKEKMSFNGQELQIITKIVDYTLQPDQSYEGVWHAEGMSHENIVMTGI